MAIDTRADTGPASDSSSLPPSEDHPAGRPIGRYVVLERLGQGAMGVVYAAYDPELDRRVAVKLLRPDRPGTAGEAAHARLLREAQAMARLSHPNVVTVHDVGEVDGRVFVAMEFVDGGTLREWQRSSPGWRRVLEVYRHAGEGLAAAHAAGLVHRDFKPDNVLVARDGRVLVGDFGLARSSAAPGAPSPMAEAERPVLDTRLTLAGSVLGTPAYMPPERLGEDAGDARSDQFSFCAALHEAVYGERPFEGSTVTQLAAAVRSGRIRPAPAGTDVPAWLRAVILRGLASSPDARYASMRELLAALAGDPERRRRRRVAAISAGFLAAAVGGGLALLARGGVTACSAADRLDGIWDATARHAVSRALLATERPFAADTSRAVQRLLDGYAAGWSGAYEDACRASRVRREQSAALMDLRMDCLAQRRAELGALVDLLRSADGALVDKAVHAAGQLTPLAGCANVVALTAPLPPPKDPAAAARVAEVRAELARIKALEDAGRFDEGVRQAAGAVEAARATGFPPVVAEAQLRLGWLQQHAGEARDAGRTLEDAVATAEAARHDALRAEALTHLAWVVGHRQSRPDDGLRLARMAGAALARMGGDAALEADLQTTTGVLHKEAGRYDEAVSIFEQAVALSARVLGPAHPLTINAINNLANTRYRQGRLDEAQRLYERTLELRVATFGPEHPVVVNSLNGLGNVQSARRDWDAARQTFQRALAIAERSLGQVHPHTAVVLNNLSEIHIALGDYGTALTLLTRALEIDTELSGPAHPDVAIGMGNIGDVHGRLGDWAEAARWYERSLRIKETAMGPDHPSTAFSLFGLAQAHLERGGPGLAVPLFERSLAIRTATGADPVELAASTAGLARALWESGTDRPRARRLAAEARRRLSEQGERARGDLRSFEAWMRSAGLGVPSGP